MSQPMFSKDTPNADLVRAVLDGEGSAFDLLVTRYFPWVFTIIHARLGHPETAEDLAQEVFIRAFLHLDRLRDPAMFVPWLGQITRNIAHDWAVKDQRTSSLLTNAPFDAIIDCIPDEKQSGAREFAEIKEEHEALRQAIFLLPVDQREVVMLLYFEGFSRKEIAQHLGVHSTTVWRLLHKARKSMKCSLESTLRDAAPAFRASPGATTRTIGLIAAISALSSESKATLVSATGGKVWAAILSTSTSTTAIGTVGTAFLGGLAGKALTVIVAASIALGVALLVAPELFSPSEKERTSGETLKITPAAQTETPSNGSVALDKPDFQNLQVRVLWADNRAPAHGTSVTLSCTADANTVTVLTDYSGIASFQIPKQISMGEAVVEIDRAHALPSSATLSLHQDGTKEVLIRRTYEVFGAVYQIDEANNRIPVVDAEVLALGVKIPPVRTDSTGGFRQVLTSQTVQLLARAGTLVSAIDPAKAPTYRLVHGIANGPYILMLGSKGDLLVSVLDKATLGPVVGAHVELNSGEMDSPRILETDSEGICEITGLNTELVTITAVASGYARKSTLVNLKAENANIAVLTLSPAGIIHVYTVDKEKRPFGRVPVRMVEGNIMHPSAVEEITTDENGYGTFGNVPIGPPHFLAAVSGEGKGFMSEPVHVVFNRQEPTIDITIEVTTSTYRTARVPSGNSRLTGRITNEDDQPVPGLDVTLLFAGGPYPPTLTDSHGEFRMTDIRSRYNKFALTVKGKGYIPIYYEPVESDTHVDLVIRKALMFKGLVVDAATSAPISMFTVRIDQKAFAGIDSRDTDGINQFSPDGTFTIENIFSENTTIEVNADNYSPSYKRMQRMVKNKDYKGEPGQKEYMYERSLEHVFSLRPTTQLKGVVIDKATREPIGGALVGVKNTIQSSISSSDARESNNNPNRFYNACSHIMVTDDKGEFAFDIYRDKAEFLARADTYSPVSVSASKNNNGTDGFVIALSKAASLQVIYPESYMDRFRLVSKNANQYSDTDPAKIITTHYEQKTEGNSVVWDYLDAGKYSVLLQWEGHNPISTKSAPRIDIVYIRQGVVIKKGETTTLKPDATTCVSGKVTINGKPASVRVSMLQKQDGPAVSPDEVIFFCSVYSNTDGNYETPLLASGEYEVWIGSASDKTIKQGLTSAHFSGNESMNITLP